jgi:hypothetical protein
MRIFVTVLTLALLAAWSPVTTVQAQPCEPSACWGKNAKTKTKPKKVAAVKEAEKVEYMKAAN